MLGAMAILTRQSPLKAPRWTRKNLPDRRLAKKRIKSVISKQRFTDRHDFLTLRNILLAHLTNYFLARRETMAQRVFVIFWREGTLEHLS